MASKMSAKPSRAANPQHNNPAKLDKIGKRKRRESHSKYINKIKNVHCAEFSHMKFTKPAMNVLKSFVDDCFERIATEASHVSKYSRRSTLLSADIEAALRLVLPPELARLAVNEGKRAIAHYTESTM